MTTKNTAAADLDHDFTIRNVCEVLSALLRDSRLTTPQVVERMRYGSPAYDEARTMVALGILAGFGLAWQDADGVWSSRNMRILFFDDDYTRHRRFDREAVGHSITHAYSPEEAVAALEKAGPEGFDVVYLDHDMFENPNTKLTGLHVAEWIAANPRFGELPIVVHSLNPEGSTAIARTLQATGHLVGQFAWSWQWPPITSLVWLRESEPAELSDPFCRKARDFDD